MDFVVLVKEYWTLIVGFTVGIVAWANLNSKVREIEIQVSNLETETKAQSISINEFKVFFGEIKTQLEFIRAELSKRKR